MVLYKRILVRIYQAQATSLSDHIAYNIIFIFTASFVRREYRKPAVLPCAFRSLPLQ